MHCCIISVYFMNSHLSLLKLSAFFCIFGSEMTETVAIDTLWLLLLTLCKDGFTLQVKYNINFLTAQFFMDMPPHSFIKKDAGPIKDWWKSRIIMLIDTRNEEGAQALYKEFYLGDSPQLPERYWSVSWNRGLASSGLIHIQPYWFTVIWVLGNLDWNG